MQHTEKGPEVQWQPEVLTENSQKSPAHPAHGIAEVFINYHHAMPKSEPYLLEDKLWQTWNQASTQKLISGHIKQSIVIHPDCTE